MSTILLNSQKITREENGFLNRLGWPFLLNMAVDVSTYIVLTRLDPFFFTRHITAKIIAFGLGALASLLVSRPWDTSNEPDIIPSDALRLYRRAMISVIINIVAMYFIAVLLFMDDILAAACASVITFALSHENAHAKNSHPQQELQNKTA